MNSPKKIFSFLLVFFLSSNWMLSIDSTIPKLSILEKEYASNRKIWQGVLVEGIGVDGAMLGDSKSDVLEILGKPSFRWGPKKNPMFGKFDHWKVFPVFSGKSSEFSVYVGIPNNIVLDLRDNKYLLFVHPFFSEAFVYYDRGIVVYFDEQGRAAHIKILFQPLIVADYSPSGMDEPKLEGIIPYKPWVGRIYHVAMSTEGIDSAKLRQKYSSLISDFDSHNFPSLPEISLRSFDTIYSLKGSRVITIDIISPRLGGIGSTITYECCRHDSDVIWSQKDWRTKHGLNQYIRID